MSGGVLTGEQRRVENRRDAGREGGKIGAEIRGGVGAQRHEPPLAIERQLRGRHVVAAVRVGEEGLAALGGPLDRAPDAPARPDERRLFRVQKNLRAEAPAHIGRYHAHLVLRKPEDEGRHQQPLDVWVLARHVQGVRIVRARIGGICGARLDGVRNQPIVDQREPRDVRRLFEGRIHRAGIADRPGVAEVIGRLAVHRSLAARCGFGVTHNRQRLVIHLDEARSRLGLRPGFGDHQGDLLAGIAHGAFGEHRMLRLLHRTAIGRLDQPAAGQATDSCEVLAGEHGQHARCGARRCGIDRADLRVRVRAAQEAGVALVRQRNVVGVLSSAGEEAVVLFALDRAADEWGACCVHADCLPASMVLAAVRTALTIF